MINEHYQFYWNVACLFSSQANNIDIWGHWRSYENHCDHCSSAPASVEVLAIRLVPLCTRRSCYLHTIIYNWCLLLTWRFYSCACLIPAFLLFQYSSCHVFLVPSKMVFPGVDAFPSIICSLEISLCQFLSWINHFKVVASKLLTGLFSCLRTYL